MSISAEVVRQLREETGAGMMDCKSALVEAQGDMDKARDLLRKKGLAAAAKKASRTAADGAVGAYILDGGKAGAIVEVNCETDFVAKTPDFQSLVKDIAEHVGEERPRRRGRPRGAALRRDPRPDRGTARPGEDRVHQGEHRGAALRPLRAARGDEGPGGRLHPPAGGQRRRPRRARRGVGGRRRRSPGSRRTWPCTWRPPPPPPPSTSRRTRCRRTSWRRRRRSTARRRPRRASPRTSWTRSPRGRSRSTTPPSACSSSPTSASPRSRSASS